MSNSIYSLDVRFMVESMAVAELIRDNFTERTCLFEAIEQHEECLFYRVRYRAMAFGFTEYSKVCKIIKRDSVAFAVYSK